MKRKVFAAGFVLLLAAAGMLFADHDHDNGPFDPGPRPGVSGAGSYYAGLNPTEQGQFQNGLNTFNEIDDVQHGLGPGFNGNSCAQCHAQPAPGGSSPGFKSPQHSVSNPQVELATDNGADNTVPSFITSGGPVREVRFKSDGGVHDLYTIAGRSDANGCREPQTDFTKQSGNLSFRIPTPTFGLGLVEATSDDILQASFNSSANARKNLGITGHFNSSGNDGTITRFGWKAQNKSLIMFAGEAYNVEQGVTNELFPNERNVYSGCIKNPSPEDSTHPGIDSDIVSFAIFARLSAPPAPVWSHDAQQGQQVFTQIGCAACHTTMLMTGPSIYTGMSYTAYHPYSDFAVHHMGSNLADGISQGNAGPDEFRTAPLWGVGQRLFFLHDGRTSDLNAAIQTHSGTGSEANRVIQNYNNLSNQQKQALLNFLRSL